MLNSPIELEIYVSTPEIKEKEKVGIDYEWEECDLKKSTFFVINAIYPCTDKGKVIGTYICVSGYEVVTPMEYEKVKALINKRI